jgi:hypothetical protein
MFRWKRKRLFLVAVILLSAALALSGWEYSKVRQLEHEFASLKDQYELLQDNYEELKGRYGKVWTEQQATSLELEQPLTVPYTSISEGEITWVWKDMDENLHKWVMPMDNYRSWVNTPKPRKTVALQCNGEICTMLDYRPYVHPDEFSEVIPGLYQEGSGGREFVQEAFNLVSQLTIYSEDIGEVPRWPIETLTEGKGDCEDLTILLASLLKAAPYPYKLSFVYIDVDNPTEPQYPDHVILAIEHEDWKVFAECSNDQGWNFYHHIKGWFFKL